ncbi:MULTISPECIES: ABC transporter ATP-binding protein [Delftia]|jgi:branched-chain amino acid transport system ATP-binding protein|uniref:ABC transporter ATP-binding protein n=1 Tax=Delftia TaxID=80865 RepID=UPI000926BE3E|nr:MULTISPECIES: ABC transporter ATP-binding protein [Delftia]MDH0420435.1 ABC transporter ATP-binding protein [Delftia tsuruhatensis]OJX15791.1 MAG: high-affinity branched-chain amino acid ABC transporter ATP-binding protein LivG [Delftia sp. 67-8]QFS64673.1 ATP-binding cassette domain-containing protein [Delftia tsuruhatensis]WON86193.1 ABC transporter ATP-binding protein [Delftia sp. UGAL515B_04]
MSQDSQPLLRIEGVSLRFGGIVALDGVSFDVAAGQICGLIGPNGAGKSSLFNCLSRLYAWQAGHIRFRGQPLATLARHRMAALGMGRTFQNLALFSSMTVADNVRLGTHSHQHAGFVRDALRLPGVRRREEEARAQAQSLMALLELTGVAERRVADLPFGTQKRVELARALACRPQLLLLDEPACGLNHEELAGLGDLILSLRDRLGLTVLLVEHHMGLVMRVSDKVVALNFGRKIAEGTPGEVRSDAEVIRAYLGSDMQPQDQDREVAHAGTA